MYTTHGHHIEGTARLGSIPSSEIEACDPVTCEKCLEEISEAIRSGQVDGAVTPELLEALHQEQVDVETSFHHAVAIAELFAALRHEITANYIQSRERSMVATKIDEAELWLTACKET